MIDKTPNETSALDYAGLKGGEYLESIGKFDLSQLSPDEYAVFVETVVTGWFDKLVEMNSRDHGRLAAVNNF